MPSELLGKTETGQDETKASAGSKRMTPSHYNIRDCAGHCKVYTMQKIL